jgi:hypothetical protein
MGLADGNIGGPLPYPVGLYPSGLLNADSFPANNIITLAPGQAIPVPRGSYMVGTGGVAQLQWLDPVTTIWRGISSARDKNFRVISDGNNFRVGNFTGCPVAAVVTNGGTAAYAQVTTTVSASPGNSTWLPVIGGQVSATATIVTAGAGYGMAPLCFVPAPPAGGVQASFVSAITNGTVSSITNINQGAGYPSAPPIVLLPNPFDPNLIAGNALTNATATLSLVAASGSASAGKLTALLCTNPGAATTIPTLTVTGAGSSAAATAVMLWTATGISLGNAGAGLSANSKITSVGGVSSATAVWANPDIELTGFIPRVADMGVAIAGATLTSVSAIYDGGLFTGTPTPIVLNNGITTTAPTLTFTLGSVNATVFMQPLG